MTPQHGGSGRVYPCVEIDLEKLATNVACITGACRRRGIEVAAVTKVVTAHPATIGVLLEAGVTHLADSRLDNLRRVRAQAPDADLTLLRLPMPSRVDEIVRVADASLNSEETTLRLLNEAAGAAGTVHEVVLMVDLGDLREGVWPDAVADLARCTLELPNISVRGVGTNLACYGGVKPTPENMQALLSARDVVAEVLGHRPPLVSGGNSASWLLLASGKLPVEVNELRIGEALYLGTESIGRTQIEGTRPDVFTLCAEVIESQVKPSVPIGELGENAFGEKPQFEDRGRRRRAIVAVGRQDVVPEGLVPELPGADIIGASSDHMIVDVEEAPGQVEVGDVLRFTVRSYAALLAVFTSDYVAKYPLR